MIIPAQGTVHGKTIHLDEDPGLPEGQKVTVVVTVRPPNHRPGDGLHRSAGAWADDAGIDAALEQIERERKAAQFRESNP